jgi:hypothetical protein
LINAFLALCAVRGGGVDGHQQSIPLSLPLVVVVCRQLLQLRRLNTVDTSTPLLFTSLLCRCTRMQAAALCCGLNVVCVMYR